MQVRASDRKRLQREEQDKRLDALGELASAEVFQANHHWRQCLSHAIKAGAALQNAYEVLRGKKLRPAHGRWKGWLHRHLPDLSYRRANEYRQVYNNRQSPLIGQALADGMAFTSVRNIMEVLRPGRKKVKVEPVATDDASQGKRDYLVAYFRRWVEGLDKTEIEIFTATKERAFEKMTEALHDTVCHVTDVDYYGEPWDRRCKIPGTNMTVREFKMRKITADYNRRRLARLPAST